MGILDEVIKWEELEIPPPPLDALDWQYVEGAGNYPSCLEANIDNLIPQWLFDLLSLEHTITIRKYPMRYVLCVDVKGVGTTVFKRCYHHTFENNWHETVFLLRNALVLKTAVDKK